MIATDATDVESRAPLAITLADTLAIFAPATTLILAMLLFENWVTHLGIFSSSEFHTPLLTVARLVGETFGEGDRWSSDILLMISLALLTYICGHLINAISSILVDRTLVYKAHGYPYRHLFGYDHDRNQERAPDGRLIHHRGINVSKAYWRGLFFWTNVYLSFRWLEIFARSQRVNGRLESVAQIAADAVGYGILAMFFLRLGFVFVYKLRRNNVVRRAHLPGELLITQVYVAVCAGLFQLFIGNPVGKVLLTRGAFDATFLNRYESAFQKEFGLDPKAAESNNYWLSYLYIVQRSPRLSAEIAHWQRLYTFSRNLSTALYCGFLYGLSWFLYHGDRIVDWQATGITRLTVVVYGLFGVAAMLLVYFYLLYVSYYSKLIFRAFVFLTHTSD